MAGAVSSLMLRIMGDESSGEAALDSIGKKGKETAATLAGIAVAAVGVGAGFQAALDQASAKGNIMAKLGVTPEEADKLGGIAGKVYANAWGDSLGEVTNAVAVVKRELGSFTDDGAVDIQGLTEKAFALSTTFDQDLTQVVRAAGQMIKTGLAKNAEDAFDVLTVGFQNGTNVADDLLDTFSEYSTIFRQLGLDGKTALGILSQGLRGGARDSDVVADSLKEFYAIMRQPPQATIDFLKKVGINATAMTTAVNKGGPAAKAALIEVFTKMKAIKDPTQQAAFATAVFGTKSEDMAKALFTISPQLATTTNGLDKVAGASKRATDAAGSDATSQWTSFGRSIQTALGQSLLPLIPVLQQLMTLLGPVLPQIVGIAGAFLVMNVAVKGFQIAATVFGGARAAIQATSLATSIFQARLAGAAAINAGGFLGSIANGAGAAARGIATAAVATGQWVATQAGAALAGARTAASVVATNVAMAAQATWAGIIRIATLTWTGVQWLLNASFYGFPLVWIIAAIVAVVAIIVLIATKTTWFQDLWKVVWAGIVWYFNFVVGIFKGAVATLVYFFGTWLPLVIRTAVGLIIGTITGWWNWFMGITRNIGLAVRGVGNFFFVELPARIRAGIAIVIGNITGFVTSIWNKFWDITRRVGTIGRDIITGIWNGISGAAGWFFGKIWDFATNIWKTVASALGVGSPSKVMADEVGHWIPAGIAVGITGNAGVVDDAMAALATSTEASMNGIGTNVGPGGGGGGDINVTVPIVFDGVTLAKLMLKIERQTGMIQVSPA